MLPLLSCQSWAFFCNVFQDPTIHASPATAIFLIWSSRQFIKKKKKTLLTLQSKIRSTIFKRNYLLRNWDLTEKIGKSYGVRASNIGLLTQKVFHYVQHILLHTLLILARCRFSRRACASLKRSCSFAGSVILK